MGSDNPKAHNAGIFVEAYSAMQDPIKLPCKDNLGPLRPYVKKTSTSTPRRIENALGRIHHVHHIAFGSLDRQGSGFHLVFFFIFSGLGFRVGFDAGFLRAVQRDSSGLYVGFPGFSGFRILYNSTGLFCRLFSLVVCFALVLCS